MTRLPVRFAAILAALWVASPAHAVKFAKDGVRAGPVSVYLTRTITVSVAVEDTSGHGSDIMEVTCAAEPDSLVRAAGSAPPPAFTCTPGGRSAGWYGYETAGPGVVRFRVTVSVVACETGVAENLEMLTPPVTIKPVPIGSSLSVSPRRVGPGDPIEIALTLRNEASEFAIFGRPVAEPDMIGRAAPLAVPVDGPVVEPAGVLAGGNMTLPVGSPVRIAWRFRAGEPGEARFRVMAAGLIMITPPVTIRRSAVLDLSVPAPSVPAAVGRTFVLRSDLRAGGEAGIERVAAWASWSPPDAARLGAVTLSASRLDPSGPPARATFALELLQAGPLMLTVTAVGIEEDSGRRVEAGPVTRLLAVQAPPRLDCLVQAGSATALVGSRVPVRVGVVNRSKNATQGLSPLVVVREGAATLQPFAPLYQNVAAGTTAWFASVLVPDEPGPVEIAAQVTGRGDRGGNWITAVSEPVRLLSLAEPRLLVFALPADIWEGVTSTVRFLVKSSGNDVVRLNTMSLTLSSPSGLPLPVVRPRPVPLRLGPGESATLSFPVFLPATKAAYAVTGILNGSGVVTPYGVPFTVQLPARPLAGVRPRATQVSVVEPEDVFRPQVDPFLFVEWTTTMEGEFGLAVIFPDGRLVKTVRPLGRVRPGRYRELWRGDTQDGGVLAPGRYLLRLAGPSRPAGSAIPPAAMTATAMAGSQATGWPADARWRNDRAFQVAAP